MTALAFGGVVDKAGVLDRLVAPVLAAAKSGLRVVSSLVASTVAANLITADQYIALMLPARMFNSAMKKLGFAPQVLTRTVSLAAVPTSALVPWNSCGAYMSAALGISTITYLPYAFFNLLCPVAAIVMAAAKIQMTRVQTAGET
jgi:NhaC family Na+:H+ antiporter